MEIVATSKKMETETVKTVKHTWIVSDNGLSVVSEDKSVIFCHAKNNTDAKLIATACNSHYELLKCLAMIDECLSDGIPIEKDDPIHKVVKHLLTK